MSEELLSCVKCDKKIKRDDAYRSPTLDYYCKNCAAYEAKNRALKEKVDEKNMFIIFLTVGVVIALLLLFGIV